MIVLNSFNHKTLLTEIDMKRDEDEPKLNKTKTIYRYWEVVKTFKRKTTRSGELNLNKTNVSSSHQCASLRIF